MQRPDSLSHPRACHIRQALYNRKVRGPRLAPSEGARFMPWQNQGGGGPWGGGGSGGGGGNSPWGRGGGQKPPNFEDLFRQGQDRFKRMFPGGPGGSRLPLY